MTDALFLAERTLVIASRSLFFLIGEIVKDEVRIRMTATAGPAHRPLFREAIDAIEFVDNIGERRSWVALGFRYVDAAELERWEAMAWEDVDLRISSGPRQNDSGPRGRP